MLKGLPYAEGDAFAVPLAGGGFAVGVVARMDGRGTVLGYFFGPRREQLPELSELTHLQAIDNVLITRFGDVGLIEHDWPIVGHLPGWQREEWPMPAFGRYEELTDRYFRVEYADDNPNSLPRESLISQDEFERLPEDDLAGYRFVEALLAQLLPDS